uniref:Uncharacterized protein n=1 Tax=Megaselia scalaris TaxID=36166 RepID=T1GZV3_MEGSC
QYISDETIHNVQWSAALFTSNIFYHAPQQQVSNPFRRQINDGFKPKQQQQQQQFFVQQSQSIEVPFNQKNNLINQRPPAQQNRFPVPNQFAPPQPKSNPVFQRSLENQLRIPQQPYQVLPSTQVSSVVPKEEFHSQNFLTLRNHKHVVQGTLFSAGMRFYQVKDSLANGNSVILQKTSAGKIKVNDAHMVSSTSQPQTVLFTPSTDSYNRQKKSADINCYK